ncbi:PIN domain-containing protein [Paracoccus sp. KR1-242]|uniref:PIN domain-containing protein n=1 Tax=Paracoccus sp. KR1-242 TaxID=3410028 RepID=UPI003C02FC48
MTEQAELPHVITDLVARGGWRLTDADARLLDVPLDTETALAATDACRVHGLATADAIIYATAQTHGSRLLTCNALPRVTLIAKLKA